MVARTRLNVKWVEEQLSVLEEGKHVEITTSSSMVAKGLIMALLKKKQPYKIYNLGAGVRRITTDTNTCPCCGGIV